MAQKKFSHKDYSINVLRNHFAKQVQHPIMHAKVPTFDLRRVNVEEIVEYIIWLSKQNNSKK